MSVFSEIKIFPSHGTHTAVVTWNLPDALMSGTVDVAFSLTGAPDSWELRTNVPVPAYDKEFTDAQFLIQAGVPIGYYKLVWTDGAEVYPSEAIGLFNDMNKREYGITSAILRREFMIMRATNGFPVFHFIMRTGGELAKNADPDMGEVMGEECAGETEPSFDKLYKGGFYPPLLTWIRPTGNTRGSQTDREDGLGSQEQVQMQALMLAFPQPMRWHMLVDPVTDRRFIISDVKVSALRANVPNVYEISIGFLQTSHPAYKIEVPRDVKDWRQIKPYYVP